MYDKKHAQQVERLSLIIFDKIAKAYGMGEHERLLLRATCILHDIGKYICMRSHSIYTYQLIMSTDIIGLSEKDKKIVALARIIMPTGCLTRPIRVLRRWKRSWCRL